jgi:acetolactate synthase I/II/III large subunit
MRHGGQILIDQLALNGIQKVFCVPGESYLAALDGLYQSNSIETIICRQEGGAAMMAEAYGKMTNLPGICFCTRGPGATNASAGVHVAMQDSTPMILFVGQVAGSMAEREAFQEIDYRRMYGDLAKWIGQIDKIERIPEYVSHAFHTAMTGRPGPVVLALPEDMLSSYAEVENARPAQPAKAKISLEDITALQDHLQQADKPLMIVGGPAWSAQAQAQLMSFAERVNIPVAAAFRYQDYMDNRHPNYVGDVGIAIDPNLARRVRETDLLIAFGPRLGEMTTSGYSLVDIPNPKQKLIHIHPGAEELGRVYRPDMSINASLGSVAASLEEITGLDPEKWDNWTRAARKDYETYCQLLETPGDVKFEQIVNHVSKYVPDDAIITNGAGNYAGFVRRYHQYRNFRTQLAPTSGSMGYALPSAIAGKLAKPGVPVICFTGDGDFMMTCQELATAVQYNIPVIIILANNGTYGTIRMHQEREYPDRISGTQLNNPDFAAMATSFGAHGETVRKTADFEVAFARALDSNRPALINCLIEAEAITPQTTLTKIRETVKKSRSND